MARKMEEGLRLRVGRTIADTAAEGPGRRFALWFQGCSIGCSGCCNPHLLPFEGGRTVLVEELAAAIAAAPGIEGVSFVGGEPFDQATPAAALARHIRALSLSLFVFTGYRFNALCRDDREGVAALLSLADLLVDGPFVSARHSNRRRWIGSDNQTVHYLTPIYEHLRTAWPAGRAVEIRFDGEHLIVSGDPEMAARVLSPAGGVEK